MAGNASKGAGRAPGRAPGRGTGARLYTPSQPPPGRGRGPGRGPNYNSPLYNPAANLSGKPLYNAARQLANVQTQGPIRDYQSQIKQNNQNTAGESRTDFGYYMQLARDAKDLVGQQTQSNAALQTQLQGIAGDTQSQLQQLGQSYQGGALGRMGALGLSGDSLGQLQAQNDQARGIAAQNAATSQTLGAQQGANSSAEARSLGAAGGLAGTEQIGALARGGAITNQGIQQKINDEIASRGSLTATALGQLRTQERNYMIASQGLKQKGQALTADARHQARADKIAGQRAATAAAQGKFDRNPLQVGSPAWARSQAKTGTAWSNDPNAVGSPAWARVQAADARNNKGGGGGAKPLTTQANNTYLGKLGTLQHLIQDAQAQKVDSSGQPLTEATIKDHLSTGNNPTKTKYDPTMIEAAYELLGWGHITPQTAAAMHSQGVRGGRFRNAPIRVAPAPTQPSNPLLPPPGTGAPPLAPGSTGLA